MNTVSLSCLVTFGTVLAVALGGCSDDPVTSNGTAGASGSAAGSTGTAGTGTAGTGTAGTGTAGAGTAGGSVGTGGGGAGTAGGGSGGMAAGAGGTAAGSGGMAGTAGAGGGAACDGKTGKAIAFKSSKIDNVTGDLGTDFVGGNGPRTLEMWAHFLGDQSWAGEHTIIELGRGNAGNQVFGIDMADRTNATTGKFDPYTNGIGDNDPTPVMAAPEGWHHLAWSYDGAGKFQFVVDGVKATIPKPDAGNGMLKTTQGIITLGGSQGFGAQGWEGELDEVRLWTVYRAEADIKRDMKIKLKGTETGLVAYWNLDEGTGTTADDVAKKPSHKLSFCAAKGGACQDANEVAPTWVDSTAPGPFTCAQ
jgi:Concanavalin A-like lectin/glucanases superfamily